MMSGMFLNEDVPMGNIMQLLKNDLGCQAQAAATTSQATEDTSSIVNADHQLSGATSVNVEDVYSMLINIMSTIESNKVQIMSKLDSLERRQKVIEDDIRMVVSAIAVNPTLRNNVMKEVNTSEFTKTVMYKVVSSLYPRCC